ncbi:MAG TPA: mechanosensitive ion channel family protein [Sphingobacteriaceae bacterium]|nr:mechanosensitive ion channel family protein [Sphingobacteriaceae bacterium]
METKMIDEFTDLTKQTSISFNKAVDKIVEWINAFIGHIPNMAVAIIVFILFYLAAKLTRKWVERFFDQSSKNDVVKNLFTGLVYYCVLGLGIFIILEVLNLKTAVTSLLAGVGIVGIALGFAFQDIAANFLSGIILAYRKPFDILDIVQMGEYTGTVTQINIRDTVIKSFQGQEVVIPNRSVIQNPIINYTVLGERRIDLTFRASFQEDLSFIKKITLEALRPIEEIVRKEDLNFAYTEFGHSFINFEIRFWVKYQRENDFINTRANAIMAIKKAFDANNIIVPFEIRLNEVKYVKE